MALSIVRRNGRLREHADLLGTSPAAEPKDGACPDAGQAWSECRVVVIIPAYNEERFIGSMVLKTLGHAQVVVVIDDGSSDSTADIAAAAGAEVIRHRQNMGKGAALNTGFCRARELDPDVVVTIDADGQHFPEELPTVIAPVLNGHADIVVGSRYLQETRDVPRHRVLGHYVFNSVTNHLSGVKVTDSQSGFRAFSRPALDAITFASQGFSVESEMQFLARELDLRVAEVPITIKYLDKPKRPVVSHGLMVLNGILGLVGQHRPLFFFGVPGLVFQILGLFGGAQAIDYYRTTQSLPVVFTLISVLLITLGTLAFFTGIILHSVRGLLLNMLKPRIDA